MNTVAQSYNAKYRKLWLIWTCRFITTSWIFLAFTIIAYGTSASVSGQINSNQYNSPALQDTTTSILRILGALIFVIAIFLIFSWLFKHINFFSTNLQRKGKLQICEIKPIGQRHSLIVLSYENKRLLISTSPNGVNFLCDLPNNESADTSNKKEPVDITTSSFASLFQKLTGAK